MVSSSTQKQSKVFIAIDDRDSTVSDNPSIYEYLQPKTSMVVTNVIKSQNPFYRPNTTAGTDPHPNIADPSMIKELGLPLKSSELGKTISIPFIKNMGIHPVRSSMTACSDSAQHTMYLRVATPFDNPKDRPYSMMSIARDHEDMKQRLLQRRQDPKYKYEKEFNLKYAPKMIKQKAAMPNVPDYFWSSRKKQIRLDYITGMS